MTYAAEHSQAISARAPIRAARDGRGDAVVASVMPRDAQGRAHRLGLPISGMRVAM